MKIKVAQEEDKAVWDRLVMDSPNGSLFHTWDFLKLIEKHTGDRLFPLMGIYRGNPLGVYPLYLEQRRFVRIAFSPPPRTMLLYLGPAISGYDSMHQRKKESLLLAFQNSVDAFIQKEMRCNCVKIMTSPGLLDSRPLIWSGYHVEPLSTYTFDLSDMDKLWQSFDSDVRRGIEKTEKAGVVFREGKKKEYDFLVDSLYKRLEEQDVRSWDYGPYFDDVYKTFHSKNIKILAVDYQGETVGGLIHAVYQDRMSAWIGIPKTNIKGIYPNYLTIWKSMEWAHEHGYRTYEIMDGGDIPRLKEFKAKFNPDLSVWYSAEKYSSSVYRWAKELSVISKSLFGR